MKRISLITFLVTCFLVVGHTQPALQGREDITPSSDEILKKAYEQAASEHKNVFVIFHASWCGWCHKMDKSMNDVACKQFFDDNYIIVHLVVDESKDKKPLENYGANELRAKYYGDGLGIPFWLVFDKDGKLLSDSKIRAAGENAEKGKNTGCPATAEEVAFFIDVVKNTSTLNTLQLEIIRKRFRENE